jgi:hypothetical protein
MLANFKTSWCISGVDAVGSFYKHIGPCSFSIKLAELLKQCHLQARCWLSAMLAKSEMSWGVSEVGGWRLFKDNGACLIIFNHM